MCVHDVRHDIIFAADINECAEGRDNCDVNADCRDTDGSYFCRCRKGYFGDGRRCKVEPVLRHASPPPLLVVTAPGHTSYDCDDNAVAVEIEGSLLCECNEGFEGDGFNCSGMKCEISL